MRGWPCAGVNRGGWDKFFTDRTGHMYLLFSLITVAAVEAVVLAAAIMGWTCLKSLGRGQTLDLEALLTGTGLGLALFSFTVFALMAARQFSLTALAILLVLWYLFGLALAWQGRQQLWIFLEGLARRGQGFWGLALAGLMLALLNLLPALMPSTDWDGLAYHLALLKIYLQHGGFIFRPDIFHNLFPQAMDMLFALGLASPAGQAAKVLNVELALLCAVAVYVLGRKLKLDRRWAAGAGVLFYAQYIVHLESGTTFIELGLTFYVVLALMALLNMAKDGGVGLWPPLALFFFGMTAASKWHGLVILALGWLAVAVTLVTSAGRPPWPKVVGKLIAWGALGVLPIAPYMIRNLIFTGNPLWPLAYGLFGGPYWDSAIGRAVVDMSRHYAGWVQGWSGLWRLPWDFLAHTSAFSIGAEAFRWPLMASLVIALGVWLARHRQPPARASQHRDSLWAIAMGVLIASYLVFWFLSSPQFRFLLPLLPLWALAAMGGLKQLWQALAGWRRWSLLALPLGLVAFHPPIHWDTPLQLKILFGAVSPATYLSRHLEHYQACRFLNQAMGPGEKVLLFGENRGFYLDKPYLWGDPLMQKVINFRTLKTKPELAATLRDHHIAWVLYREDLYTKDYYAPQAKALMKALLVQEGEVVYSDGPVKVYHLYEGQSRHFAVYPPPAAAGALANQRWFYRKTR